MKSTFPAKSKQSYFSKLVTVNACACLDLPDYTGATLSAESIAQFTATLKKEQSVSHNKELHHNYGVINQNNCNSCTAG